jgi:hypothetical protein
MPISRTNGRTSDRQRLFPDEAQRLHKLPANIHPNNRGVDRHRLVQQQAALGSDCLWPPCTAHKRCHISLAASHRRREHSPFPQHCLRPTQYQPQLPRLSPYVPPLIQVQHLPERLMRCQRLRCQLQRHSPPGRGIGSLSLAERKPGSTDRRPGKTHKTCWGGHGCERWSGRTAIGASPTGETECP